MSKNYELSLKIKKKIVQCPRNVNTKHISDSDSVLYEELRPVSKGCTT